MFLCQKWLADDEGDQLIERDLFESEDMRLKRRPSMLHDVYIIFLIPYSVAVAVFLFFNTCYVVFRQ